MDIKEKIEMILHFNLKRLRFEKINFNDFLLLREEMKREPMSLLSCRPINDKSEENLKSYFEARYFLPRPPLKRLKTAVRCIFGHSTSTCSSFILIEYRLRGFTPGRYVPSKYRQRVASF